MVKKGLSFDEKKKRLLEYMYEKKEVFRLKDLEKGASKDKGIVSQTVKEVLTALVDEGLVDSDKIGSGVFFWALPSKATVSRSNRIAQIKAELKELEEKKQSLASRKRKAMDGREESDTRAAKIQKISENEKKLIELNEDLKQYSASDPEVVEQLDKAAAVCLNAANRWTDNLFNMIGFMKKNNAEATDEMILDHFELPKDLDQLS